MGYIMQYETEVKAVMRDSIVVCDKNEVHIPQDLDNKIYQQLKGVFARLDIQWDRSKGCHVFSKNPLEGIQTFLETSKLPKLNPTAFFPTPPELTAELFEEWLDFDLIDYYARCEPGGLNVLEPSAGTGAIADQIKAYFGESATIDTVEYLPENAEILGSKGYNVENIDFLDFSPERRYDYIIMNPPFSLISDRVAYMTHVRHAQSLLKPRGKLIAILPTSWTKGEGKKEVQFREFVASYQSTNVPMMFPKGAFKESGTMVETMAIELDNEMPHLASQEINGFPNWGAYWFSIHSVAALSYVENSPLFKQWLDLDNAKTKAKLTPLLDSYAEGVRQLLAKENLFFTDVAIEGFKKTCIDAYCFDVLPDVEPFEIQWQKTKGGYEQSALAF